MTPVQTAYLLGFVVGVFVGYWFRISLNRAEELDARREWLDKRIVELEDELLELKQPDDPLEYNASGKD